MIYDGEYGVMPFGGREFCDQVHGDSLKWSEGRVRSDMKQGGMYFGGVDFGALADSTSFYVVLYKLFHVWPPEVI